MSTSPRSPVQEDDPALDADFDVDYTNESHIEAFMRALNSNVVSTPSADLDGASSPLVPSTERSLRTPSHRVRKISAMSDFAPINTKTSRR